MNNKQKKAIVKFVKAKEYSASIDGVEFYKDTANNATWGTGDLYIGKCQTESASLLAFNFYSLKFYNDTKKELIADYTVTNRRIDDYINNKKKFKYMEVNNDTRFRQSCMCSNGVY